MKLRFFNINLIFLGVLVVIATAYWPVLKGQFVWDDIIDFHNNPGWLVVGDGWKHYIFRDFHGWTSYFRPFVVAMFLLQVRLFDVQPGPMHAVSLAIHLINTLLVGLLARHGCRSNRFSGRISAVLIATCMLFFGLHPAMIEPVAWIACQFDLTATMFMLLGLLASATLRGIFLRPICVAICFFLAACSKESAMSFPLMLAIFDWVNQSTRKSDETTFSGLSAFLKRNITTYAAVLLAGLGYLAFRQWGLAQGAIPLHDPAPSILSRVQVASHTYWTYWRVLFLPSYRMGPVHEYNMLDYVNLTAGSFLMLITAAGAVLFSMYFFLKNASALGGIVLILTAALLPVLHLLPTGFDPSLYHDRYLMTGLASICVLLPHVRWRYPLKSLGHGRALIKAGGILLMMAWSLASITVIRATLPLWGDSLGLWRWAVQIEPRSDLANGWLLATYMGRGMGEESDRFAENILKDQLPCTSCFMNIAILRISQNRLDDAEQAIEKVRNSPEIVTNEIKFGFYMTTVGDLLMHRKNFTDAESAYRSALRAAPADPNSWFRLGYSLTAQGKRNEAANALEKGLEIIPPQLRDATRGAKEEEARLWLEKARSSLD